MEIKDAFEEIFVDVKKVLVVLAHPDDMEIVCGGTIARITDSSKNVRLVVTTNGGKGMKDKEGLLEKDFAEKRVAEQIKAGEILGIPKGENFNLQIPDGEFDNSLENIEKLVFHIRQFKPDLVITHNPNSEIISFFDKSSWVNHRDHRNTGLVTLDAAYPYSRDRGFFTKQFSKDKLEPHLVTKILLADSYSSKSLRYFAVDKYLEKKKLALKQHLTAFDPADAEDYLEENKFGDSYFEPLGFYKIY